ncbi:MAG: hypothetical protein ABS68_11890 [Niastella sp. SCN 39-18]|nr:DUF4293 domain-containing protein [Sphingobacteriales bacterium]ODT51663.1 MAG: hypothetical protein ABS68_11890 [Niastella sp. SCN 39-18]OJW09691.1 MAG: hypothetical protein BGO53_07495 [Sphingobacteriales bacterium 39-19]
MLQRIQSLWLLLASACSFATLKLPFYMGIDKTGIPNSTLEATDSLELLVPTIALGVLSLLTIFLFKNRSLQIRFIILGILLEAVLLFLYYNQMQSYTDGQLVLTSIIHVFVFIFLILGLRGVLRDNKIIKESNRLR